MPDEMRANRPEQTRLLTKGALRYLRQAGYAVICELRLNNNRRVDIMGIDRKGKILIVEVKSGGTMLASLEAHPVGKDKVNSRNTWAIHPLAKFLLFYTFWEDPRCQRVDDRTAAQCILERV